MQAKEQSAMGGRSLSMKRNTLLPAVLVASLATALAQAQTVVPSRVRFPQHQPNRLSGQVLTPRTQSPRLATMVPPDLRVQCQPEADLLGATCGKLPVPLDRQRPAGAQIGIYFELYH